MTTQSFNDNFASLINGAINAGVPIHEIILTVGTAEFDLRMAAYRMRQQQQMHATASKIIPASAIPPQKN